MGKIATALEHVKSFPDASVTAAAFVYSYFIIDHYIWHNLSNKIIPPVKAQNKIKLMKYAQQAFL